ncbi:MAG: DUF87 domain-containing protein [Nitrososphaerales archaeon]|nr:DUF87 domain-containing protein [Nitrososphaerales archaeon]
MRKIGIVASESSEVGGRVLLQAGEEKVRAETIVQIDNTSGKVIGVLRRGLGVNETLTVGAYRPGVAYAKKGGTPSSAREIFSFNISVIGRSDVTGVEPNKEILAPRSDVCAFEPKDKPNPMELIALGKDVVWIGNYEGVDEWKIPVDSKFIPYHIAVYGATGSGKSWLARYALIPLLLQSGYRVLVLDWSGTDYTPYLTNKESINNVRLDEEAIIEYLCEKARNFGYSGYQRDSNPIRDALEDFVGDDWASKSSEYKDAEELKAEFERKMKAAIDSVAQEDRRQSGLPRRLNRGLKRISAEAFSQIMGVRSPRSLSEDLKDAIALDMSGVGSDEKLSFFVSLADYLLEQMQAGKSLKLALVIDEAPQYSPWEPQGLQHDATERIKALCALGRKHELCMTLVSQGISGDIGINASVRRNLNTVFFGSIHPLDMEEAKKWLEPYGIPVEYLLALKPGRFYFSGKMNPSPIPLLMTFKAN